MRRWRNLKLRRGTFWSGAAKSPVPPAWPPRIVRPAGPVRFGARLLPSARRRFDPPWGQGNQGTAFPSWEHQAGTRVRFTRAPRSRRFDPPWPQANQGQAWPSFTRQPRSVPARGLRLFRGRRFDPPWPQGSQGQAFPSWMDQAGSRPRWAARPVTSRGRRFDPPWFLPATGAPPQYLRQAGALKTPSRLLPSVRRRFDPAWPQANQGQAWPSWGRQPQPRARFTRAPRGRRFDPPWSIPAAPPAPQMLRAAGALRAPARLLPSRRRRFDPPWGQANRGQAWPSFAVQAGMRTHVRSTTRRARFFEPPWAQAAPPPVTVFPGSATAANRLAQSVQGRHAAAAVTAASGLAQSVYARNSAPSVKAANRPAQLVTAGNSI